LRDSWYTWSQSYKTKSVNYNPSWTTWYIHQNLVQQINGKENWHKHVTKFDGTFYNIWIHRLTFILKAEKLWNIINGTVPKSIAPTAAQINRYSSFACHRSKKHQLVGGKGPCLLPHINSCLDNSVIHMFNHVQHQI